MIRLEVRDLRLVAAINELGNLTRAGQHLHLTQSALSHQLTDLEQRIGGKLFERSGRRLIPTRIGEHLCEKAKVTLDQLREVERDLTNMATGREATLRIATECYTCYHWLPPVLDAFRQRHPGVDVRIVPGASSRPLRALTGGAIDLCVASSQIKDRRVTTTRLFNDEVVLAVSERHALAGRRSVEPAELRNEHFLTYSPPDDNTAFQEILAPAGVSASQISVFKLTEAIIELVKANMGVALFARWAVTPYLESGAIRTVRINHPSTHRTWKAVTRSSQHPPEYLADFVRFLANSANTAPHSVWPIRHLIEST
jgi:LysR family transcriptional regulator for metE and metH